MAVQKKIVLITGANGGVGFDTAAAVASLSEDYHVIIGSRSLEKGKKALAELQQRKLKGSLSLVQLEVTEEDSIANAVKTVEEEFGVLDTLVNNAGIVSKRSGELRQQLHETFETNTFAPALVTEAFIHLLKKSSDPRIIHVTSELGSIHLREDPSYFSYKLPAPVYRMSKAALNMLAVCHNVEYGEYGVKAFAVCPGYVVTNLTGEADRERRIKTGAGSSEVSGHTISTIVAGQRDHQAGGFLYKDNGIHPW